MSEEFDGNESLGIIAEFTSLPEPEPAHLRAYRFCLQSAARRLLPNFGVCRCLRRVIPDKLPEIHHSVENEHAGYRNLQLCMLIHVCPVCAARIARQRQVEIRLATEHMSTEWVMLTYTMRHNRSEKLRDQLTTMCKAYSEVHSGKRAVFLHEVYGWIGSIRIWEVTHGKAGWHFHFHELVCRWGTHGRVWDDFESDLRKAWVRALNRQGRDCNTHGFSLSDKRKDIADYVTKYGHLPRGTWDDAAEVTAEQYKDAEGGRNPWHLLDAFLLGDRESGRLFQEYAVATRRKQKVVWSKGLRDKLDISEERVTAQLSENCASDYTLLAKISIDDWRLILRGDHRAELLRIADTGDRTAIFEFIERLRARYAKKKDHREV